MESEDAKKKNQIFEKIDFNVVQIKFFAMHITNRKLNNYIFMVGNVQDIFMEHDRHLLLKKIYFIRFKMSYSSLKTNQK